MIPKIRWTFPLLLLVLLVETQSQNARSYDTNDWIPITPSCPNCRDDEERPLTQKKPLGRVLNLADAPNQKNFFPDDERLKSKKTQREHIQQYLRETTPDSISREKDISGEQYDTYVRAQKQNEKQKYINQPHKIESSPENSARPTQYAAKPPQISQQRYVLLPQTPQDVRTLTPDQIYVQQQQLLAAQHLLSQPVQYVPPQIVIPTQSFREEFNTKKYFVPVNASSYNREREYADEIPSATVQTDTRNLKTVTTPKDKENESIQLLYVPIENLSRESAKSAETIDYPKQTFSQIKYSPPREDSIPQFSNQPIKHSPSYKQQQLENIQSDFARQALEAHKLQMQLKQGYVPVAYTTTPRTVTKKRKPHQPPLALYMGAEHKVHVSDVLEELKHAESIAVQDNIGPDTPKVFVGPSNLDVPHTYAKFELPYLSSLENNRIQRKVDGLPFFVAPLSYKAPPGYSKIPLPSPHVGSVVVNTKEEGNRIATTAKPTNYYRRPNEPPIKAFHYITQQTTAKPTTSTAAYPQYFKEINSDLDLEPVDGLFENQASRRQPVSLTIRNRQPTQTSQESGSSAENYEIKPTRKPSARPVTQESFEYDRTRPSKVRPHYDESKEELYQTRRQPTFESNSQEHVVKETVENIPQQREEVLIPSRRQPTKPPAPQENPPPRQPINQSSAEEELPPKRQPSRTRPTHTRTSYEGGYKQSKYEPDLGYEKEIFPSRGRTVIPTYYTDSFEYVPKQQSRLTEVGPPESKYIMSSQKPLVEERQQQTTVAEKDLKPPYDSIAEVNTQPQYKFVSTTPSYSSSKEEYDTGKAERFTNIENKNYIRTTETPASPTPNALNEPRYTTLEEFSIKSSTPAYPENQFIETYRAPEQQIQKQSARRDNTASRAPNPYLLNSDIYGQIQTQNGRQEASTHPERLYTAEPPKRTNVDVSEEEPAKRPSSQREYVEQYQPKTKPAEESDEDTYNLPSHNSQLPDINPILPGLINNLQDHAIKPLLVPQLLSPTTESPSKSKSPGLLENEYYSAQVTTPTTSTTTESTTESTTSSRRNRGRQRAGSRFNGSNSSGSSESTTASSRRAAVQRGRRPQSRPRQETVRHDYDEISSTTEYFPVKVNEYTTESSRRHITHSPRQRFKTRGRPTSNEENSSSQENHQSQHSRETSREVPHYPPPKSNTEYKQTEESNQKLTQRTSDASDEEHTSEIVRDYRPLTEKTEIQSSAENTKRVSDFSAARTTSESPRKSFSDDYNYNVDSAESLHNDYHHETTTRPSRIRSRGRGRPRFATTAASTTVSSTTTTTTTTTRKPTTVTTTTQKPSAKQEEEEDEFYGFIRPPSFNSPPKPIQLKYETKTEPPQLQFSYPHDTTDDYAQHINSRLPLYTYQNKQTTEPFPEFADLHHYDDISGFYTPSSSTASPKLQYFEFSGTANPAGIQIYTNEDFIATTQGRLVGEGRPKVVSENVDQQHLAATAQSVQYVEQTTPKPEAPKTTSKIRMRIPHKKKIDPTSSENIDYKQSSQETARSEEDLDRRGSYQNVKHIEPLASSTESANYVRQNRPVSDSYGRPVTRPDLPEVNPEESASNSYGEPVTRLSQRQKPRGRGTVHFQLPVNLKQNTDDDDVEGGNYPATYLKQTGNPTQQTPSFQITVEPDDTEHEYDQVPYSSIQRPSIVLPDQNTDASKQEIDIAPVENKVLNADDKVKNRTTEENSPTEEKLAVRENVSTVTEKESTEVDMQETDKITATTVVDITTTTEAPKTKQGRKRGAWRLIKQRPVDHFETAESQNYHTAVANSFAIEEKPSSSVQNKSDEQKLGTSGPNFMQALYDILKSPPKEETSYPETSSKTKEETGTTLLEETEHTTLAEESAGKETNIPIENVNTSTEPSVTEPTIHSDSSNMEPWQMKAIYTTTSTEISHETEICYKGRCVKSTSSQAPTS